MLSRILSAAMAMFLAALPALAEDLVDNPLYKSWADCNPGSTVVIEMNTAVAGQTTKGEMVQKLVEVNGDQATIETRTKMTVMGQTHEGPPTTTTVKAKVPKSEAEFSGMPKGTKGTATEAGNETIEAGGKSYDCRVIEFNGEHQGSPVTGKSWLSDAVPGTLVKATMNNEGQMPIQIDMQLVSVDLK